MKKFSLILVLLATLVVPLKSFSQLSEIEVKNIISQASEKCVNRAGFNVFLP